MRAEKPTMVISQDDAERLGLGSYFTGDPCKYGHMALRRTVNGQCRECVRIHVAKVRSKMSPEEIEFERARCRQWHARNKEGVASRKKDYAVKDRAGWKARRAAYRLKHNTRAQEMMAACRWISRKRGLPFDLDKEWIMERLDRGHCELTGIPFNLNPFPMGRQNPYTASLDRIKPELGYVKSNVRMILWALNAAFNTYGENVYAQIAQIYLAKHPVGTGLT